MWFSFAFPTLPGVEARDDAGVVQANSYSAVVGTLVVAEITSNLTLAGNPACLFAATEFGERWALAH